MEAEKKKTINRPFSPRSPKYRTQVYAPPAAIPPKKPQMLANKFALAKVGLIMQSAPKNATTIAIACLGRTFSLMKIAENTRAKKGLYFIEHRRVAKVQSINGIEVTHQHPPRPQRNE